VTPTYLKYLTPSRHYRSLQYMIWVRSVPFLTEQRLSLSVLIERSFALGHWLMFVKPPCRSCVCPDTMINNLHIFITWLIRIFLTLLLHVRKISNNGLRAELQCYKGI
jgi:hypothetical protein